MFSSKKSLIVLLSLTLFSCGDTQTTDTKEILPLSPILSQTDSLLSIVDEEFEHIIHDSEVRNRKVNELEGRVEEYVNVIVLDKKEQSLLNSKIKSLIIECQEKDSINKTLLLSIENLNYQIKKIEESNHYKDTQMKEQTELYEAQIYRLEDSIYKFNQEVEELKYFIKSSTKITREGKNNKFEYLYNDE